MPTATMNETDQKLLNASVVYREDLTPELAVIRVKPDKGDAPDFKPGQYATIGLPPAEGDEEQQAKKGLARFWLRPYSIASSPLEKGYLEFYIALVEDGALTPKLWDLAEGDRLWMGPKCKGTFTMDPVPAGKTLVTISTGTGLAPFMSMYKTYRDTGRWEKFVIVHGTRFCGDLGYKAEIEALAEKDETLTYLPTCSREPEPADDSADWLGLRGRVNVAIEEGAFADLTGVPLDAENCHVFLCGNPQMIEEVEADLQARGFVTRDREHPEGNIHHEKYW